MLSNVTSPINSNIAEYLGQINITKYIVYEPDFYLNPPDVTNNSIRLYFRGSIFLAPVGYQNVSFPEVSLNFESSSSSLSKLYAWI